MGHRSASSPFPSPPAIPSAASWASLPHPGIRRALSYIHAHYNRRLTLAEVASVAYMSQYHFSRLFHRIVGVRFQDYLVKLRVCKADEMLKRDPLAPLTRVAARTGLGTLRNLEHHYKRFFGHPPSEGRARLLNGTSYLGGGQHPSPFEQDTSRTHPITARRL